MLYRKQSEYIQIENVLSSSSLVSRNRNIRRHNGRFLTTSTSISFKCRSILVVLGMILFISPLYYLSSIDNNGSSNVFILVHTFTVIATNFHKPIQKGINYESANFDKENRLRTYGQNILLSSQFKKSSSQLESNDVLSYATDESTSVQQQLNSKQQQQENQKIGVFDKQPRSKSLLQSFYFFINFVITEFWKNRNERYAQREKERIDVYGPNSTWKTRLAKLNEQRLELVDLANYSMSIVAPSFLFLFLGALTKSFIPHYWAECIQHIATVGTNTASASSIAPMMLRSVIILYVLLTLTALFTGLRGSLFWTAGSRANYNVRVKLHRNILVQDATFFDTNETGYLLSRLNNDVNKIGQVISYHINVVCRQLAQCIFGTMYMIKISPILSLYTIVGIGFVAIISSIYGDFNRELSQRVQDKFADATAVAETSLSMSETVRAFDGVSIESEKYEIAQYTALELEEVQSWGYGVHKFVSDTVQEGLQIVLVILCWYAGRTLSIPGVQLTSFLFYANFVLESSNEVGDQWAKIQGAIGASTSVFDLIRRVPLVRDPDPMLSSSIVQDSSLSIMPTERMDATGKIVEDIIEANGFDYNKSNVLLVSEESSNGDTVTMNDKSDAAFKSERPIISVKNITVTYGSMEIPALNEVSLDIYHGDRVAIVGRSGSGKSSMLRTMLRFYDPQSGFITLNGINLKNLTRAQISSSVSVVEQQPSLFPMSLLDNVLYGIKKDSVDTNTSDLCYSDTLRQSAEAALREAGLPVYRREQAPLNDDEDANGNLYLDTRVGEGGRSLSGGQAQRLAIARTLVRDPQVILLDEPTAALDSVSEKKVIVALQNALRSSGECMVMVTHRLNVLRSINVNRVVVMDQGRIVEVGDPEKLLKVKDSHYRRLAQEQGIIDTHENIEPTDNNNDNINGNTNFPEVSRPNHIKQ